MKVKALIAGLVTGIILTAQVGIVNAAAVSAFSDVPESRADYNAIMYLYNADMISGYPDGTFVPDRAVNRAEALKMIMGINNFNYWDKAVDGPIFAGASTAMPFTDLDKNAWYYSFVQEAYDNGLVSGYPDGTFKPDRTINTVEGVKILLEHTFLRIDKLGEKQPTVNPFNDADKSQWYANYVLYAKEKGIVRADSRGEIGVDRALTRGMLAQMIYRAFIADGQTFDAKGITVNLDEKLQKFIVYNNGMKLAELPGTYSPNEEVEANVLKVTNVNTYVSVCATGFGGYINYSFCNGDTYAINIDGGVEPGHEVEKINFNDPVSGAAIENFMDVSVNGVTAWTGEWTDHKIYTVGGGSYFTKSYDVPAKYGQYGDVRFSPDGTKIAYAAIVGNPDNEESAVYTINLADGKQTLVKEITGGVLNVYGWSDNDTVNYSTALQN